MKDKEQDNSKNILSKETVKSLINLDNVLQEIHNRLIREDYVIKGDKIYKPKKDQQTA